MFALLILLQSYFFSCQLHSHYFSEIVIKLRLPYGKDPEQTLFVQELPDTLGSILQNISATSKILEKITLVIDGSHRTHLFQEAFSNHNLLFPTVKRVVVGRYNNFLVKHCPNTAYLSMDNQPGYFPPPERKNENLVLDLISAASQLGNNLKRLILGSYGQVNDDTMNGKSKFWASTYNRR
jgi:hypothetical protein